MSIDVRDRMVNLTPGCRARNGVVSDAVIAETSRALNDHELIKVRISGMEREARDEALELLATKTGSAMPGRIGHTALLYKPNKEKPKLALPKA